MSVILDLLNKSDGKITAVSGAEKREDLERKTRERLAETYLSQSAKKRPAKEENTVAPAKRMPRKALLAGGLSILCLLAYFLIAYAFSIDVTITRRSGSPYPDLLESSDIMPAGRAYKKHSYYTLRSIEGERAAMLAIEPEKPVDLASNDLLVSALLKEGSGTLKVILRDTNHRSYLSEVLELRGGGASWRNFIVSARDSKDSIDIRNIGHIRLAAEGEGVFEVYVKNVLMIDN
jgi:hypothetical protein